VPIKNPVYRRVFFLLGVVATALGIIGIFLPILPTTPFLLLAAWCFLRSSPRAHAWLYRQPGIGDSLRNWDQNRSISRKAKIMALSMIGLSLVFMWMKVSYLPLKIGVSLILFSVSVFLVTRPEN